VVRRLYPDQARPAGFRDITEFVARRMRSRDPDIHVELRLLAKAGGPCDVSPKYSRKLTHKRFSFISNFQNIDVTLRCFCYICRSGWLIQYCRWFYFFALILSEFEA
jgi:hypothetical protein